MSLTLYINKSDSVCECSGKYVDPQLKVCPHCGGTWTHLSSHYGGLRKLIEPMRPDLIPDFHWDDFWQSEAGRLASKELGDLNNATEESA